jgi:cytochrome bd ubiquinol oxidase subunit I
MAARLQMEVSLGFHMFFAALGIGMPLMMLIAEWQWLRTGQVNPRSGRPSYPKSPSWPWACGRRNDATDRSHLRSSP